MTDLQLVDNADLTETVTRMCVGGVNAGNFVDLREDVRQYMHELPPAIATPGNHRTAYIVVDLRCGQRKVSLLVPDVGDCEATRAEDALLLLISTYSRANGKA